MQFLLGSLGGCDGGRDEVNWFEWSMGASRVTKKMQINWVYKTKRYSNGRIERYNARLVAKMYR